MLVDGIYPEISRFVKTISEPTNKASKRYAKWQESCRKDIERAFGVLQRKFQILCRPIEQWYIEDITNIVRTTIVLHNMMVQHRVERSEAEASDWYEYDGQAEENVEAGFDPESEHVERQLAEYDLNRRLQEAFYHGPAVRLQRDATFNKVRDELTCRLVLRRWDTLYDVEEDTRLREAIKQHLININR